MAGHGRVARIFEDDKGTVKMTNREKYRFDDFTLSNYHRMLELALARGFQFIGYVDEFIQDRKNILCHHL